MDDFLTKLLLKTFSGVALLSYAIHWGVLLPAIKKYRKVVLGEWLFPGSGYNVFSYLEEYKMICKKEKLPLTWYKIQWGSFIFIFVLTCICFIKVVLL